MLNFITRFFSQAPHPDHDDAVIRGLSPWPFSVRVDGDDLLFVGTVTCFGGNGDGTNCDPQDNGDTASGNNTTKQRLYGCSIAMDSRQFPSMKANDYSGYTHLYGAPFPRIPWGTKIEVTINGVTWTPPDGIIDLGPGIGAQKECIASGDPMDAHVLDLTVPAAQHFAPNLSPHSLSTSWEERGSFRIIGGAKYVPPST